MHCASAPFALEDEIPMSRRRFASGFSGRSSPSLAEWIAALSWHHPDDNFAVWLSIRGLPN
jgi:hypothetical protein